MAPLEVPLWAWLTLGVVVAVSLGIDLVGHRGDHGQSRRAAIVSSVLWIALALAFGGGVAVMFGMDVAEDYLTAYLVEKSLSIDNLFVFLIIFARLQIPKAEQHRVLQWGIIGAFVTRGLFIAGGAALLSAWHGVVYVLGAFLIFTGVKTAREHGGEGESAGDEGRIIPFLRRHFRFTPQLHGHRFLAVENGRLFATPLLLALIVIELSDMLFAVDSIPAVFAVSEEPFIVYSSNVFAILGLRALYLVLADALKDLAYFRYGLGAILVFAGAKMIASHWVHLSHVVSLLTIVSILALSIVPSVIVRRKKARTGRSQPA